MIIIEGIDGTGKTSLSEKLALQLALEFIEQEPER